MSEPTWPRPARERDAASLIFDLPGYDVIDALDLPRGGRRVVVQAVDRDEGCPACGVVSTRVHQWTLPDLDAEDAKPVRFLGIDEHRFRTVHWFRDPDPSTGKNGLGAWRRVEPWMSTFVDLQTGQVIDVVDGRDGAAIRTWLAARSQAWRDRVEVVAIDPSAPFGSAVATQLPHARVSVDHWHLIRLANLMVTYVRQRVAREQHGRRGTTADIAWAHRMLLLRAGDRLSERGHARLEDVFRRDDPTGELGAAWGVKGTAPSLVDT